ncbi:YggT family protein [Frankineae bacterium MT45]|nr:YggT family protein [Frankineae bacterium MT45]
MNVFWASAALALYIYLVLILARIVIETTRQFARSWRPAGFAALGVEAVYVTTDPPVRLLRRLIPPIRIGEISLDVSIMILLIAIFALRSLALQLGG